MSISNSTILNATDAALSRLFAVQYQWGFQASMTEDALAVLKTAGWSVEVDPTDLDDSKVTVLVNAKDAEAANALVMAEVQRLTGLNPHQCCGCGCGELVHWFFAREIVEA